MPTPSTTAYERIGRATHYVEGMMKRVGFGENLGMQPDAGIITVRSSPEDTPATKVLDDGSTVYAGRLVLRDTTVTDPAGRFVDSGEYLWLEAMNGSFDPSSTDIFAGVVTDTLSDGYALVTTIAATAAGQSSKYILIKNSGTQLTTGKKQVYYDASLPSPQWDSAQFDFPETVPDGATLTPIWVVHRKRRPMYPELVVSAVKIGTFDPRFPGQNGTITAATNTSPIDITTSAPHGLANNQWIVVSGGTGNTAMNGSWEVTVVDATHATLKGSVGNGAYTGGGTWKLVDTLKTTDSRPLYSTIEMEKAHLVITSGTPVVSDEAVTCWACNVEFHKRSTHTKQTRTGAVYVLDWEGHTTPFKTGDKFEGALIDVIKVGGTPFPLFEVIVESIVSDFVRCFEGKYEGRKGEIRSLGGRIDFLDQTCTHDVSLQGKCIDGG